MQTKKILIVLMSLGVTTAYADFNPFDVFNTSNNANPSNVNVTAQAGNDTSSSSASLTTQAPATAPAASNNNASPYTQMQPLTAPTVGQGNTASKQNTSATQVQINPNAQSLPANRYTAANSATQATIGLPISGSGGQSTPASSSNNSPVNSTLAGSILEALNLINKNVLTINNNMVEWKTKKEKSEIAAGAQLVPTTTENLKSFLLKQSGLSNLFELPLVENTLIDAQNRQLQGTYSSTEANNSGSQALALLAPFTQSQLPNVSNAKPDVNLISRLNYLSSANNYYTSLVGYLPSQAQNANLSNQIQIFDLINYAVLQIAGQTKLVASNNNSIMGALGFAVATPFNAKSANNKTSWFEQLQTASTPQLLRTIAILLAENNQIQYLQLQNMQTSNMLQAGQLTEAAGTEQRLIQLSQAQAQTNDLLNKILTQMIAQNNKK